MKNKLAEAFPPGEFVRDELEARGWSQRDFAEITGRPLTLINEVINGKRGVSTETAVVFGEAFDTGPEFWLSLGSIYQLWKTEVSGTDDVRRKAKLYEKAPVAEMIRRGWLQATESVDVLEEQILSFFEIQKIEDNPRRLPHAARKGTIYTETTPAQNAWLYRARQLAHTLQARRFTETRFARCLEELRQCFHVEDEIRRVPAILAEGGVRLVVIEHLQGTKIDGACLWLDRHSPVVAISMRFDRIDSFWFGLVHELGHVMNRDGLLDRTMQIDVDLLASAQARAGTQAISDAEQKVDAFAAAFLVDQKKLSSFISETTPFFYKEKIRGFAKMNNVHPGIVAGQLQYRGAISYAHSRDTLVKVRDIITSTALTDGWGRRLSAL